VRTSEIKLQLNNAAGGRLKRNSRRTVGSFVLFQFYFTMSDADGQSHPSEHVPRSPSSFVKCRKSDNHYSICIIEKNWCLSHC